MDSMVPMSFNYPNKCDDSKLAWEHFKEFDESPTLLEARLSGNQVTAKLPLIATDR